MHSVKIGNLFILGHMDEFQYGIYPALFVFSRLKGKGKGKAEHLYSALHGLRPL